MSSSLSVWLEDLNEKQREVISRPFGLRGYEASTLEEARRLRLRGRYEESAEIYSGLREAHPTEAALGLARCRFITGSRDQAEELLKQFDL